MGEALFMGWCLAIIQIALLWTIVGKMLTENHAPSTLHTSFVDLEIEWADCNRCKKNRPSPILFSVSQTSATRLTHTFPQSNVVDWVDPHLSSIKRRRLGRPTPSLSQTASTRLTHIFPHFYVILYLTCSRPEYR